MANAGTISSASARRPSRVAREGDLEWFWGEGQALFESSSFGDVVERQARYGQEAVPCSACGASGITEHGKWCRTCIGSGYRPPKRLSMRGTTARAQLLFATSRCGHCHGCTGRVDCPSCKGTGAVVRAPVGVHSGRREEPSFTPDENGLTRYAQVSRWLMGLGVLGRVLEAYYGTDGYRWGATKWGRIMAVVPFTAAGRALLKRADNPFELDAPALLANAVDRIDRLKDAKSRSSARERLVEAIRQAFDLYMEACGAWNAAVDASRSRRKP